MLEMIEFNERLSGANPAPARDGPGNTFLAAALKEGRRRHEARGGAVKDSVKIVWGRRTLSGGGGEGGVPRA